MKRGFLSKPAIKWTVLGVFILVILNSFFDSEVLAYPGVPERVRIGLLLMIPRPGNTQRFQALMLMHRKDFKSVALLIKGL